MLGVNNYSREYIESCRTRVAAQIAAYQALIASAGKQVSHNKSSLDAAVDALESHFFAALVLALDNCFAHRTRAIEKKDGNPLNEVGILCTSILNNDGVLCADKTIKYDPTKSVLKYKLGDEIKLSVADFELLASSFLTEIGEQVSIEPSSADGREHSNWPIGWSAWLEDKALRSRRAIPQW
jgi:hypothetical protein